MDLRTTVGSVALRAPVIARGRRNRVGPYLAALNALIGWEARDRLSGWKKPLLRHRASTAQQALFTSRASKQLP